MRARRIALTILVGLMMIAGGAVAGRMAAPFLARTHYVVQVAEEISRPAPGNSEEEDLQRQAFRTVGVPKAALFEEANRIRDQFAFGATLFGIWCGLVVALKLAHLLGSQLESEFVTDKALCFSCARCFKDCPVEHERVRELTGREPPLPGPRKPDAGGKRTSLILMGVATLVVLIPLAAIVFTYLEEKETGVLTSTEVAELKAELNDNPQDQDLKEAIRKADSNYRLNYFQNRDRFRKGALLIVVSLGICIAAGHWFVSYGKKVPTPPLVEHIQRRESKDERDREWATGITLGLAATGLTLLVLMGVLTDTPSRFVVPPEPAQRNLALALPPATRSDGKTETAEQAMDPTGQWPNFRGIGNVGLAGEGDWPTEWDVEKGINIAWRVPLQHEGKSSPVIWEQHLFLTSGSKQSYQVAAHDTEDGSQRWIREVAPPPGYEEYDVMDETGFAASTPATDGRRVFALFATGVLVAIDFDGQQVWRKELGLPDSLYGFASSLLMAEGRLILQYDQGDDPEDSPSALYCFDPATGDVAWKTDRPVVNSWSSPSLIDGPQGPRIITTADPWIIAYHPSDGREIWRSTGLEGDIAPSPCFDGERLVFVTNDMAQLMAIRTGGSGDVSGTHVEWTYDDGLPDTASPVCDGAYVLQAAAGGMLTCFDKKSGQLMWEHFVDSSSSASPIVAADRTYVHTEDGTTYVLRLAEEYEEISRGTVGEELKATPAYVRDSIFLRTPEHLIRVRETE